MIGQIFSLTLLLVVVTSEVPRSGPYPASGWKPSGAPFTLPKEFIPQPRPGNAEVETSKERVEYLGQLTETTTVSNAYLPPPDDASDEGSTEDYLKVQGLPSNDRTTFNPQKPQKGQLNFGEYNPPAAPNRNQYRNDDSGEFGQLRQQQFQKSQAQQFGQIKQQSFGQFNQPEQPRQFNSEPQQKKQFVPQPRQYTPPQQQFNQQPQQFNQQPQQFNQQPQQFNPQPQQFNQQPQQFNQQPQQFNPQPQQFNQQPQPFNPQNQFNQQPQFRPQQRPAGTPQFGHQGPPFRPSQGPQFPPPQGPQFPSPQGPHFQPPQGPQFRPQPPQPTPSSGYGPPKAKPEIENDDDDDDDSQEQDQPAIAVANSLSTGQYYVLTPDNTLQRVSFETTQNAEEVRTNGFSAQLRYMPVEPIRDPIYAYNEQGQLIRIFKK